MSTATIYNDSMQVFVEGKERIIILKSQDGIDFNQNNNFDGWGDDLQT